MPKDRGAEPGDVDGPRERSLALGVVASETRLHIAEKQAAGTLSWVGAHDADVEKLQEEHQNRMTLLQNIRLGGPEKLIGAEDPRHANEASQTSGTEMVTSCGNDCTSLVASLGHSQR